MSFLLPNPTGSPFWLYVNGAWAHVEGIVPEAPVTSERPRSSLTTAGGNRYEQRAALARRSWSWSLPWATSAHVALAAAAADSPEDVWLWSEATGNMLAPRDCMGTVTTSVIDCGGVPMRPLAGGAAFSARVRAGVPTTFSAWLDSTDEWSSGLNYAAIVYPGGTTALTSGGTKGQHSVTFTPDADGTVSMAAYPIAGRLVAGPVLTEALPPLSWLPGESMPCKVAVDDPGDVLKLAVGPDWLHDYTISLREVG